MHAQKLAYNHAGEYCNAHIRWAAKGEPMSASSNPENVLLSAVAEDITEVHATCRRVAVPLSLAVR